MSTATNISIRGYHCDAYGHVNNARYLELFEEARWQMLEELHFLTLVEERNWHLYLVAVDVKFKKPVKAGDEVSIITSVHEFGRKTITFEQKMVNEGGILCCIALVKSVIFDDAIQVCVNISTEIQSMFENEK